MMYYAHIYPYGSALKNTNQVGYHGFFDLKVRNRQNTPYWSTYVLRDQIRPLLKNFDVYLNPGLFYDKTLSFFPPDILYKFDAYKILYKQKICKLLSIPYVNKKFPRRVYTQNYPGIHKISL